MDAYLGLKDDIEILLDKNKQDLQTLEISKRLETKLNDLFLDRDLGKKIILVYDEDQKVDLNLRYLPERSDLKSCNVVEVTINKGVYGQIVRKSFATSKKANHVRISVVEKTKFMKRIRKSK